MKKKILALCLVVVLAVTAVTGATLAYFTDTDSDVNVMTTGGISIVQNEHQRNKETGELEVFADNKPLYPATGDGNGDGKIDTYGSDMEGKKFTDEAQQEQKIETHNGTAKMFNLTNNAVDKIVTVTNTCELPVYVRTLFAFEMPNGVNVINNKDCDYTLWTVSKGNENGEGIIFHNDITFVGEDGKTYFVGEYYYNNNSMLENQYDVTQPSLCQIYLNANADNDDAKNLVGEDNEYKILVLSQATQVAGFESVTAEVALDTAFADIVAANADTIKGWFNELM